MANWHLRTLESSDQGKAILVSSTSSPGSSVHLTGSAVDEIVILAANNDTVDRDLTIQFGGTTVPDNSIQVTIPTKQGLVLVIPGLVLQNDAPVRAFASAANVIGLFGKVIRSA